MPNVMGVLRAEIRRLARKETRQEVAGLRKHINSMRRRLAESRRRIQDLESRAKQAVKRGPGPGAVEASEGDVKQVRFSPSWVKRHRSKLGMSRRVYAKLLSVSPQTIMGWETGRTRPRRGALRTWRAIRGKGIRELKALVAGGATKVRRERAAKRAGRKLRVRGRNVRARGRRAAGRPATRRAIPKRGRARRTRAATRRAAPRRRKPVRRGRRPRAKKK